MKMIESGYYPPGAEFDPNAPYNQTEPEETEFRVRVIETIERETVVSTADYIPSYDDGYGYVIPDTTDTDWDDAYSECYLSVPELIREMASEIETILQETNELIKQTDDKEKRRKLCKRSRHLSLLVDSAKGWDTYDNRIIEQI